MLKSILLPGVAVVVCGFMLGMGLSLVNNSEDGLTTRGLASIEVERANVVRVSVRATKGVAQHEEQEMVLTGMLRLDQAMPSNVYYAWELPPGVTIVNGQPRGEFMMNAKEVREVHLTVRGFSEDDLKILAFHGFVKEEGTLLGTTAAFSSRPGDNYKLLERKKSEN